MPAISRALATLRVIGADLDPSEISHLLGCVPTRSHRKGEDLRKLQAKLPNVACAGLWALEARAMAPGNVNQQIGELLASVTTNPSVWDALANRYQLSVFCAWFMEGGNEGEDISAETLRALSDRRITLSLDVYGPDV
jgi:hypothetical protein